MTMIITETMKFSYLHSPCVGMVFGTVCVAFSYAPPCQVSVPL